MNIVTYRTNPKGYCFAIKGKKTDIKCNKSTKTFDDNLKKNY